MSAHGQDRSQQPQEEPLDQGHTRRQLFSLFGGAAIAGGALAAAPTTSALAQQDDTPADCAPIGVDGKTPVTFKPNANLPVRVRKSAFELSNTEVDRLKSAYAALRKLTTDQPNDPRGWLRQGYVHCWYCGGGNDGNAGPEIHGGWFFFPWHRAYLYFHERILAKLVGDDNFALPYWDWDSQGRQTFPAIYGDPDDKTNPLSDMLRSARAGSTISSRAVSAPLMNRVMNQPTASLFMGNGSGNSGTSGALENAPHGPVHIWTGDMAMTSAAHDMGILDTAAQDPVFFTHHGNIDRLWSVWLGLSPTHRNFTSVTWTTQTWDFYDENSVWTRIAVSDVLNSVNSLRFQYQPPSAAPIWKFTPKAPPPLSAALPEEQQVPLVVANAPDGVPITTAPVTQSVALPPVSAAAFDTLNADSPPQFVLHIDGLNVPPHQQTLLDVYVNLPSATAATGADVPNYAGTITVLAHAGREAHAAHAAAPRQVNAAFDVTDALASVAKAAGGNLSVTLVPVTAGNEPPKSTAANQPVTYKRIYIDRIGAS
jgi:polyphenol oxidase